ncbi:hypothetical protein V6N13_138994 [Hibiscus sabdariffa]|uniref:Serpin domain-containing protein n=1 Tax=Hibiscus sabdariffa TaxID=183260 RepID=A0ABR2PKF3_9ROSI
MSKALSLTFSRSKPLIARCLQIPLLPHPSIPKCLHRRLVCASYSTASFGGDSHVEATDPLTSQTNVSLRLTKQLLQTEAKDSNLVFSPLSIQVALSLLAAGAKGPTLHQLLSFLESKSNDQLCSLYSKLVSVVFADGSPAGGPCLSSANGVWVDKSLPLKPSFKNVMDNVYKAATNHVDFQTEADQVVAEVNLWAEKETNGLIERVLSPGSVGASTRLILANALYFKGAWKKAFDASRTKHYDFHLINGSSVKVPFMTSNKKQSVGEYDGFKVLGLPYKKGEDKRRFSMYVFLPDAKDGLHALIEKVSSEPGFLESYLPNQQVELCEFRIPPFKITFEFEASAVLKRLGLELPFSTEQAEGFTEMVDSRSPQGRYLYVSDIFHKCFIEVNEEGTKAAAVTAGMVGCCLSAPKPKRIDFVADHPFLFVIREDVSGAVMFIGQVLNPLKN